MSSQRPSLPPCPFLVECPSFVASAAGGTNLHGLKDVKRTLLRLHFGVAGAKCFMSKVLSERPGGAAKP